MQKIYLFSAPGRTELGGNHTDHQRGCVLAAAVELETTAEVMLNGTDTIRVFSEGYAPVEVQLDVCEINGGLIGERRTLELDEGDTRAEALVEALSKGPEGTELFSSFPEGFAVQSVWVKDGICYVNFASTMLKALPRELSTLLPTQALRASLRSLENIGEVRFLVDGEVVANIDDVRKVEPAAEP